MQVSNGPFHVSLVAIPDAIVSTLSGIYDVLSIAPAGIPGAGDTSAGPRFRVDIVSEHGGDVALASGLSIQTHRGIDEIADTNLVIVPSLLVVGDKWQSSRYPRLVAWLRKMHDQGALMCSACSGIFLLAEMGFFDGQEATVHWSYARTFQRSFPQLPINPERVLIAAGRHQELVTSGASASWHDLVLYLISRCIAPTAAQTAAKFFALQWHKEGLAPYMVFDPPTDHGDAIVGDIQGWLETHRSIGSPVEAMIRRCGLSERTFKRRFARATGYSPIEYVQRLRIEDAKRRLERTNVAVEEISWKVGYEDAAFFRRLFKRITGITPATYRRKFQVPPYGIKAADRVAPKESTLGEKC